VSGWGEADEGNGRGAARARPVDVLDRGRAAAALGLLGVLSLVLLAMPDVGLRVVLAQQTRSLWPPLAVHSIGNALALLAGSL
jgi:hypothetical protein